MKNPFDNELLDFFVLVNNENQHSLWPVFIEKPDGWNPVFGPKNRQECLDYINKNWCDIKPTSLTTLKNNN